MSYVGPFPLAVPAGGTGQTVNPSFNVYLSSTQNNVTGDGTSYQVPFDTVVFDSTNSYNTGTFNYACPVTGIYNFNCFIWSFNNVTANTLGQVYFQNVTQATNYIVADTNAFASSAPSGSRGYNCSITINATAGDNFNVLLLVANGTKGVQVLGAPGVQTYFSGFLII